MENAGSPQVGGLEIDKRALATLRRHKDHELAKYLNKPVNAPAAADVAYAKSVGYLHDPVRLTHDELIDRLFRVKLLADRREVADAFVAGIGRRRLDWCSAIGSFSAAMHFPRHPADYSRKNFPCLVCELWDHDVDKAGKIKLNPQDVTYNRFEFGGGPFGDPSYSTFDLEQFVAMPVKPTPTAIDVAALQELLERLRESATPKLTPAKLSTRLGRIAGANKYQRQHTVETLAAIGILQSPDWPTYRTAYTPYKQRPWPNGREEWAFPANAWNGQDGVSDDAVKFWFGHLLGT